MKEMKLLFKQPPAVLRPNASAPLDLRAARRVHGMRLQAKKRLRLQARLLVMSVLRKEPVRWEGFVPVRYDVTWFFWAGVGPDADNVVASCKALLDGCADGFGINDRELELGMVARVRVKRADAIAGYVELCFRAEKGGEVE